MPRIYDEENNALDYCQHCYPEAAKKFANEGLDVGNFDCDHPDYADTDYECETCGEELDEENDGYNEEDVVDLDNASEAPIRHTHTI